MNYLPVPLSHPDWLQLWEKAADVFDIVCGQRSPVSGFIVRLGLHHQTFSATGIFHWPQNGPVML
jgi:hypothetical protein